MLQMLHEDDLQRRFFTVATLFPIVATLIQHSVAMLHKVRYFRAMSNNFAQF